MCDTRERKNRERVIRKARGDAACPQTPPVSRSSEEGKEERKRKERGESDRRIRKWRSVPRDTRSPRLFWPGSHFHGFMGSGRNLWPSRIYSRATNAPVSTFASQVAAALPLVIDPPRRRGFHPSPALPFSPSLSLPRTYPAARNCSYFPKFRRERELLDYRDRPPPSRCHRRSASFFHRPRLVQWLYRPLYRRRDRHDGYRSSCSSSKLKPSFSFVNRRGRTLCHEGKGYAG